MGLNRNDPPERRRLALMRRGDTETATPYNLGGAVRKQGQRPTPSLPKMPWTDEDDKTGKQE